MNLPNNLLLDFVRITNDASNKPKEETVFGTIVDSNGTKMVRLDGAEMLTPVTTTFDVADGERVIVTIKNHKAIVTGNTSSPAARQIIVQEISDKVAHLDLVSLRADIAIIGELTVEQILTANNADIQTIKSDYVKTSTLEADYINATDLKATYATIGNLDVAVGRIDTIESDYVKTATLEANYVKTATLEANYANIDFANIKMAAVEELFTKAGIIKDLVVGDQNITGELIGVTIKGDLIEANTLKADRLLIQGEDGLYYKLNVDSLGETTASSDQKYQTGLDGSVIIAESITANKISVEDLVSFNATIGGFKINDNSIHSKAKTSVDNTTGGIYFDNDGQMVFGDADNFVKFYKDSDNKYRLDISAESLTHNGGVIIGDKTSGTLGKHVSIDSNSVDIRDGDKPLAIFTENKISLGLTGGYSSIDLCGGHGNMSVSYETLTLDLEWSEFNIFSYTNALHLQSEDNISMDIEHYYIEDDHQVSGTFRLFASDKYTYSSALAGDPIQPCASLGIIDRWYDGGIISIQSERHFEMQGGIDILDSYEYHANGIYTSARISLDAGTTNNGSKIMLDAYEIVASTGLRIPNNQKIHSYNTNGDLRNLIFINDNNNLLIGYSGWNHSEGATNVYGNEVNIISRGDIKLTGNLRGNNYGYFKNLDVSGVLINSNSNIVLPNGKAVYGKQSNGTTTRKMLYMDDNNACILGFGGYYNSDGDTFLYGNAVSIVSRGDVTVNGANLSTHLNDTGWKTATLSTSFAADSAPKYRKIGNLVEIRGSVKPKAAITGSDDHHTIFTLPEGYRPNSQVALLCCGSGRNRWLLTITSGGLVRFARYNNGAAYVDASTSTTLLIQAQFFIG